MPIDSAIPLGIQPVQPMQSLASVVGLANGIQGFKKQQQEIDMNSIKLREQQNLVPFLQDPSNYSDANGNLDHAKLYKGVMSLAPTTGAERIQQFEQAQQAQTVAKSQILALGDEKRGVLGRLMYGVDPDKPELVNKMFDVAKAVNPEASDALDYGLKLYNSAPPEQRGDIMKQIAMTVLPQQTQQAMRTGQVAPIATAGGTQLVQTAQGAEQPQGAKIGEPLPSPNQITGTPSGGLAVVNPSTGTAKNLNGDTTPPLTNFPAGETNDTMKVLQDQRTSAQTIANQAPVLHDINREVKATLAKGVTTGQLGGTIAKLKSTLGIGSEAAEQGASDYDILGKMLERSALTAAQGMGPQTNAGLEAQIKANGSQAYNPTALKKIANLNDALVTGSEKYRDGLEKAIEANPNLNVFVKRKFDQQWAANADPVALRLLNAAKNGDKEEINDIFKTVGGPKSQQGQALRQKLMNLKSLSETGQLQ